MVRDEWGPLGRVRRLADMLALGCLVAMAAVAVATTGAAVLGWMPWLTLPVRLDGADLPLAGPVAQGGLTLLLLSLLFWLPANARMARLERSHRSFAIGMEDVSRAYRIAHAADRAGVFALSGEFDAMRARMDFLRRHPDLQHLEPELLQLAAQMSHETRELARTYSDEKVARAKRFLQERQEEVQALTDQLSTARRICDDLRRWLTDIEADERQARMQLSRLEADLRDILPALGLDLTEARDCNVVSLPKPVK